MALRQARLAFGAAILGLTTITSTAPAFAQYPVVVTGGGYARDCYMQVKSRKALPAKALETCDIAIKQEDLSQTNRAATYINRGILHMREKNHDRARKDYEAALRIAPGMPEAKINLGAMLYYVGRYDEAIAALNDGVKVENEEARAAAHFNRALAYERIGDIDSAYADYKTALALRPGFEAAAKQLQRFAVVPAGAS
ncbi:MAG: tetratricopeptide repeat protein [Hyphomonadaceae bacterium]|nr:tetratricopeptide repeat protein [Hyphomonadaceae bacterium]